MEAERRYALDALLDALGLPFDEAAPAKPEELDEVFGLLTLAAEREAGLDAHGRPLPPDRPPGPRVAELAAALGERLGEDRRGYPGGERFLIALTHDVDLLGAGGARTAVRKLGGGIVRRSKQHLREGVAFALDAARGRDPTYPFEQMLDAEAGRGSTCFFLTRQEDPHDGYPERYQPALGRALERHGRGRGRDSPPCLLPRAGTTGCDRGRGAVARPPAGPPPPLPSQRSRAPGRRAARGGPALRLEHRMALAPGPARGHALPLPALGRRAA